MSPRRPSVRFAAGLGVIAAVATALRAWVVLVQRPTVEAGGDGYVLAGDAWFYHWQSQAIAKGRGFIDPLCWQWQEVQRVFDPDFGPCEVDARPSAGHPPLYPLYLALWSRLGVTTVTGHRLASSLLGVATVVLVALLARRLAGDRAGLIAGAIAAVYPQLWINDGMLMSETVAAFATVLMLLAVYRFWRAPGGANALLLGLGVALAALARAELLALFPLVVLPLVVLVRSRPVRARLGLLALAAAGALVVLGPWVGHNLARFEEPVFLSNGAGAALSAGHCDVVFAGEFIGYYGNCLDPATVPEGLDESQRDIVAREHALEYLRDNWSRLPVVAAARVGRVWAVFKPGQTTWLDWWLEGRGEVASRLGTAGFYLLVPFAIAGATVMRRRGQSIVAFVAIGVAITAAAAITFGLTRYRVSAEVALAVLAGVGAEALWRTPARSPSRLPADPPRPVPATPR